MNYHEFKIVMMSHINNVDENSLKRFWEVYFKMYNNYKIFLIDLSDIFVFLYKKDNTLNIDELTSLASVMLKVKFDYYMSSDDNVPKYLFFQEQYLKYKNKKNIILCSEYAKQIMRKKIPLDVKQNFTFNYYNVMTKRKFNKEQVLCMVDIHFFLHKFLDNIENISLLTNTVIECFKSNLNLNFAKSCYWCYGNMVTKFQDNYFDLAYILKCAVDENVINKIDINKYFVLGALSNNFYDSDIDYSNDEILEGQKYFLSKGNDLMDTAESISDYIQDESYPEIKIDFILGIIKEGLLLKEEKLLIKN